MKNEEPIIIDFDLACLINTPKKSLACDTLLGATPLYLSPDIIKYYGDVSSDTRKKIDWMKGDVYALGILIYYLVNGRTYPFFSKNRSDLYEKLSMIKSHHSRQNFQS